MFKDKTKSIEKDVGFVEDCFESCKNMVAFEAHCIGSFGSTNEEKYLENLKWMRSLRTKYLNMITPNSKAQEWCMAKHLCLTAMTLQELSTRFLSINDTEKAKQAAKDSTEVYLKFLELNGYYEGKINTDSSA